jgi:rhamnosyltransferase
MRSEDSFLAVIVLYKTRLSEAMTFVSLTQSLKANNITLDLVVYDNSPEYNRDDEFNFPGWRITYIADEHNGGVSKAYNTAADMALSKGKQWLLIFDQDTAFPIEAFNRYLTALKGYPGKQLFAPVMHSGGVIISPCNYRNMRGRPLKHITGGVHPIDDLSLINCGLCIDASALKKNGGYNELLKLDFSDHDFIRRFKKNISNEFVLINLDVDHELSAKLKNSLESDLNRFRYYLSGAKNMASSSKERSMLRFNALMRGLKLSIIHHNLSFLFKALKW